MLKCNDLTVLEDIIKQNSNHAEIKNWGEISFKNQKFPFYSVRLGSSHLPTLALVAGVHGLERIGCEVVMSYLRTCFSRCEWDPFFQAQLRQVSLLFVPIVNPVGVARGTRSNGNGVDLMRNSPLESLEKAGFLYSGQRFSSRLPFYRGPAGVPMEAENLLLQKVMQEEVLSKPTSMAVDVHSGFGSKDRFWYPFSYTKQKFPEHLSAEKIKQLLARTYPHHFYVVESVSDKYTISGDLWDYLYLEHQKLNTGRRFIPWTLEMGSWNWVKKNPLQIFTKASVFDPVLPHRRKRILRRHTTLFDFLHRILAVPDFWQNSLSGVKV